MSLTLTDGGGRDDNKISPTQTFLEQVSQERYGLHRLAQTLQQAERVKLALHFTPQVHPTSTYINKTLFSDTYNFFCPL